MSLLTRLSTQPSVSSSENTAQRDVEVADPPADSVSALEFSPQADLLAVASWDGQVRFPFLSLSLSYTLSGMCLLQLFAPELRDC